MFHQGINLELEKTNGRPIKENELVCGIGRRWRGGIMILQKGGMANHDFGDWWDHIAIWQMRKRWGPKRRHE